MKAGAPYGSRNVRHVPAPEHLWAFSAGQSRTIGIDPLLAFQVIAIHDTWIEGAETLDTAVVHGELHMDLPVVITKTAQGEPLVTLTLRRIADGLAFIQVRVDPRIPMITRQ